MASRTSARASRGGLPTSRVITAAMIAWCSARAAPIRPITSARAGAGQALQALNPAAAALAAFSTSRSPHSGKIPTVSRLSTADLASKEGRSPSSSFPPIQLKPITVFP